LQGVGGWLLLFVLGQMVCGPLQLVSEFGSETTSLSQIWARFPQTAYILTIERIMTFGLMAFGFIVAVMLLRTKDPRPVSIAKLYLMTAPVLAVVMTFLYAFTDLPDNMRSQVIAQGVGRTIAVGIASLIWLMYSTKSKRVRATYFGAHIHIRTSLQPDDSEIWECGNCGGEVSFGARVCPHCQADVSEVAIAPPTAIE